MYNKYVDLKKQNSDKLYLFKSGAFYIFLEDDAITINKYVNLKLTNFGNDYIKCGFPIGSYGKYMSIFKRLSLNIEEVSSGEVTNLDTNYIVNKLRNIDLDNLTPLEAFNIISELKGMYE